MVVDAVKRSRNFGETFGWTRAVVVVFAAILLGCAAESASAQAGPGPISGHPNVDGPAPRKAAKDPSKGGLAGDWQINRSMSDDVRQRMEQANPRSSGGPHIGGVGGPTSGPGGGPGGPGSGGGGRRGGMGSTADEEKRANALVEDLDFISVVQKGSSVKVITDSGRALMQYPSGAPASSTDTSSTPNSSSTSAGNTSKDASQSSDSSKKTNATTTKWEGDSLVTVSQNNGTTITRTLGLSEDGTQLYLTTDLEGGRYKHMVTFRLVYDPARQPADGEQE